MTRETVEFSNFGHYRTAPSKGLDITNVFLSSDTDEIIDCRLAIEHNENRLGIMNEGDLSFFDEMKNYFGEKLGIEGPGRFYYEFKLSKSDKKSFVDALEGLDGRIKVVTISGTYEK